VQQVLKRETQIRLGQALTIHAYREIAIGVSWRFLRGSSAFAADRGDESGAWRDDNLAAFIADEQAGHTLDVVGIVYARGIMEMASVTADRRLAFRASSADWHRFLGFQSAVEAAVGVKKGVEPPRQ
jgi:hypothetical protein